MIINLKPITLTQSQIVNSIKWITKYDSLSLAGLYLIGYESLERKFNSLHWSDSDLINSALFGIKTSLIFNNNKEIDNNGNPKKYKLTSEDLLKSIEKRANKDLRGFNDFLWGEDDDESFMCEVILDALGIDV